MTSRDRACHVRWCDVPGDGKSEDDKPDDSPSAAAIVTRWPTSCAVQLTADVLGVATVTTFTFSVASSHGVITYPMNRNVMVHTTVCSTGWQITSISRTERTCLFTVSAARGMPHTLAFTATLFHVVSYANKLMCFVPLRQASERRRRVAMKPLDFSLQLACTRRLQKLSPSYRVEYGSTVHNDPPNGRVKDKVTFSPCITVTGTRPFGALSVGPITSSDGAVVIGANLPDQRVSDTYYRWDLYTTDAHGPKVPMFVYNPPILETITSKAKSTTAKIADEFTMAFYEHVRLHHVQLRNDGIDPGSNAIDPSRNAIDSVGDAIDLSRNAIDDAIEPMGHRPTSNANHLGGDIIKTDINAADGMTDAADGMMDQLMPDAVFIASPGQSSGTPGHSCDGMSCRMCSRVPDVWPNMWFLLATKRDAASGAGGTAEHGSTESIMRDDVFVRDIVHMALVA